MKDDKVFDWAFGRLRYFRWLAEYVHLWTCLYLYGDLQRETQKQFAYSELSIGLGGALFGVSLLNALSVSTQIDSRSSVKLWFSPDTPGFTSTSKRRFPRVGVILVLGPVSLCSTITVQYPTRYGWRMRKVAAAA